MELSSDERFIIEVFKEFDFLRRLDYDAIHVSIYGREPFVVFENRNLKRTIFISLESRLNISIERHRWFSRKSYPSPDRFSLRDFYEHFNIRAESENDIKINAELLKTKFMPLLKGQVWIDEILEQSNAS